MLIYTKRIHAYAKQGGGTFFYWIMKQQFCTTLHVYSKQRALYNERASLFLMTSLSRLVQWSTLWPSDTGHVILIRKERNLGTHVHMIK